MFLIFWFITQISATARARPDWNQQLATQFGLPHGWQKCSRLSYYLLPPRVVKVIIIFCLEYSRLCFCHGCLCLLCGKHPKSRWTNRCKNGTWLRWGVPWLIFMTSSVPGWSDEPQSLLLEWFSFPSNSPSNDSSSATLCGIPLAFKSLLSSWPWWRVGCYWHLQQISHWLLLSAFPTSQGIRISH